MHFISDIDTIKGSTFVEFSRIGRRIKFFKMNFIIRSDNLEILSFVFKYIVEIFRKGIHAIHNNNERFIDFNQFFKYVLFNRSFKGGITDN